MAVLCVFAVPAAAGGNGADETSNATLQDLLTRIDSLEKRNKALEGQVSELKALEGEKWLSQERADQIRSIVADVVADADARASLRQDAMTAGWNDGFFLASPDGRFKLQVSGLMQPRFMWSHVRDNQVISPPGAPPVYVTPYAIPDTVENNYGFDSNYNELIFKGHVFSPAVEYMVRTNVALNSSNYAQATPTNQNPVTGPSSSGNIYLLDAWVRIAFADEWSFRFGQYRSPFAREQLVVESNQMAVNRSTVVRNFGLWYTQGIELQWQGDDVRWNLSVDDGGSANYAGTELRVASNSPLDSPWWVQTASYSITTRLEWKPFGSWRDFTSFTSPMGEQQGLLMGVAFHTQGTSPDQPASTSGNNGLPENYVDSITADVQWNLGGASVFASAFWTYVDSNSAFYNGFAGPTPQNPIKLGNTYAYGFTVQPAIYVAPKWEWFARYEYGYIQFGDVTGLNPPNVNPPVSGIQFQNPYNVVTTGLNWYIDGQDLKWTIDFGYAIDNVNYAWENLPAGWRISGTDQFVLRTQLQLMF